MSLFWDQLQEFNFHPELTGKVEFYFQQKSITVVKYNKHGDGQEDVSWGL